MARILIRVLVLWSLWGCGGAEVTLTPPPSGGGNDGGGNNGGGNNGGGSGSLACALTGCEIAKLAITGVMPQGSATYLGRASVARSDGAGALVTTNAALHINANFTSNSLTLQLSDVTDGTTTYTGTAQGSANLSAAQFAGNYSGNLSSGNGLSPISGSFSGQFRGADAVALDGEIVANGWGGGDAFGGFFANKQ